MKLIKQMRGNTSNAKTSNKKHRKYSLVAAAVTCGLLGCFVPALIGPTTIVTDRGEPVEVALRDGSRLLVGTGSKARIYEGHGSDERVLVVQEHGEVFYIVQHDPTRPFLVETPVALVRVVGTKFQILHEDDRTEVTASAGKVRVESGSSFWDVGPAEATYLVRNQQAIVEPGKPMIRRQVKASDWLVEEGGRISVADMALPAVIAKVNRYSKIQLSLPAGVELPSTKTTGAFPLNRPEYLYEYLNEQLRINRETVEKNRTRPKQIPRTDPSQPQGSHRQPIRISVRTAEHSPWEECSWLPQLQIEPHHREQHLTLAGRD